MHHRRQSLSVRKLCSWSRLLSTKGQRYSGWINESKLQLWSNSDFHLNWKSQSLEHPVLAGSMGTELLALCLFPTTQVLHSWSLSDNEMLKELFPVLSISIYYYDYVWEDAVVWMLTYSQMFSENYYYFFLVWPQDMYPMDWFFLIFTACELLLFHNSLLSHHYAL